MNRVVTIEEIRTNPNLDLTKRIAMLAKSELGCAGDLEDIAVALIKQEYENWADNRTVVSERTDRLLQKILDGDILSDSECFEMIEADHQKVQQYAKFAELRANIMRSNGITSQDLEDLFKTIGFDIETANRIRQAFNNQGFIIDEYSKEPEIHL